MEGRIISDSPKKELLRRPVTEPIRHLVVGELWVRFLIPRHSGVADGLLVAVSFARFEVLVELLGYPATERTAGPTLLLQNLLDFPRRVVAMRNPVSPRAPAAAHVVDVHLSSEEECDAEIHVDQSTK